MLAEILNRCPPLIRNQCELFGTDMYVMYVML
jgi:hypothetical protein